MTKDKMLNAALSYAQKSIPVFPVIPKGKKPLTANGFKAATTDENAIRAWWKRHPNANIGVPTGEVSGLLVLDVDADKGGFESLQTLEEKHGAFPPTLESITGGGGLHKFYSYPKGLDIRNSAGKLGNGLDVRGNGGYVVAAPSLHASGQRYRKSEKSLSSLTSAPTWFLDLLSQSTKKTKRTPDKKPNKAINTIAPPLLLSLLNKGIKEGGRNDFIARLSGTLLRFHRNGLNPRFTLEIVLAVNDSRCKPPLPHTEVISTVQSIAGAELSQVRGKTAVK